MTFDAGVSQYRAQASMSWRLWGSCLVRRYERSVASPVVCASAASQTSRENSVFSALQQAEVRLWRANTRHQKRPPLPTRLRKQLNHEFRQEIESLSELLRRDLSNWTS